MIAPSSFVRGSTRVAGVIGDPVAHSLSPALHNAAYHSLGLDWVYVAFEVRAGRGAAAARAARTLDLVGLSVTMPHKREVVGVCDVLSDDARLLESVNTLTVVGDELHGDSTDGAGFARSLASTGVDLGGARVLLLGAGGAARAVALACARAGASCTVAARRPRAVEGLRQAVPDARGIDWDDRDEAVETADVVVNATPIGMGETSEIPISSDRLSSGHAVVDLVYHPLETPLLRAAAQRGARAVDGLGMLVEQAALQVERWSGASPDRSAMRSAALGEHS